MAEYANFSFVVDEATIISDRVRELDLYDKNYKKVMSDFTLYSNWYEKYKKDFVVFSAMELNSKAVLLRLNKKLRILTNPDQLENVKDQIGLLEFRLTSHRDINMDTIGRKIEEYLYRINIIAALEELTLVNKRNIARMQQENQNTTLTKLKLLNEISIEEQEKWLMEISAQRFEELHTNGILLLGLNFSTPEEFDEFIQQWYAYESYKLKLEIFSGTKQQDDVIQRIQTQLKSLPNELEITRQKLKKKFFENNKFFLETLYLLRTEFILTPKERKAQFDKEAQKLFVYFDNISKFEATLRRYQFYGIFVYIMENFGNK